MFSKIIPLTILVFLFSCSNKEEQPQQAPRFYQNSAPQPQYYYPPQNRTTYSAPYQQPYQPYNPYGNTAGSRFYSNPYALPTGAQNYYDADQYYIPPRYYNNDPQQNNPFYRETSAF